MTSLFPLKVSCFNSHSHNTTLCLLPTGPLPFWFCPIPTSGQQCHRAQQIWQLCKILFCVFLTLSFLATGQASNLGQCPSLAIRELATPSLQTLPQNHTPPVLKYRFSDSSLFTLATSIPITIQNPGLTIDSWLRFTCTLVIYKSWTLSSFETIDLKILSSKILPVGHYFPSCLSLDLNIQQLLFYLGQISVPLSPFPFSLAYFSHLLAFPFCPSRLESTAPPSFLYCIYLKSPNSESIQPLVFCSFVRTTKNCWSEINMSKHIWMVS